MTVDDIRTIVAEPDGEKATELWGRMKHHRADHQSLYVKGLGVFLKRPDAALFEALGGDIKTAKLAALVDKLAMKVVRGGFRGE